MSIARFNRNRFDIDTTGFTYRALDVLYKADPNKVYTLRGLYINSKGKYEPAPVFITDDCFVNIPTHMTVQCVDILNDADALAQINAKKAGFKIYTYTDSKYGKTCYGVQFVDM